MNHHLTLELNEQVFTAIQQQAAAMGIAPEHLAATLLEQGLEQPRKTPPSEAEKQAARLQFAQHFGALKLEQPTNLDNESIDADLAKEYSSSHEND